MDMKGLVIKAQISRNGKYVIELTGKCMDPLLNPGDKAEIISCSGLKTGRLYLFEMEDGNLAVHRLIKKDDNRLIMKGDRTKKYEVITEAEIIGQVEAVKRNDSDLWCRAERSALSGYITALLSRQSMYDKRNTSIRKVVSDICLQLNIWRSSHRRHSMK